MLPIPAVTKLRQEDHHWFQVRLGYIVKSYLKKLNKNTGLGMLVESWLSMQETLASITCMHRIKPGVVLHASCNPST